MSGFDQEWLLCKYETVAIENKELRKYIDRLRAENQELQSKIVTYKTTTLFLRKSADLEMLLKENTDLTERISAAYLMAVNHDDRFPFDWAILCEILYPGHKRKQTEVTE